MAAAIVCILAMTGCGGDSGQESPPALTVTCGDQSVNALRGTYSWDYDGKSVVACGSHTLSCLELMTPISRGEYESVTLDFGVEPTSMSIRCWSDQYAGDETSYEANYLTLTCAGGAVSIPTDGSYIYEVRAEWEYGSAWYSFYIVDQQGGHEAPDL